MSRVTTLLGLALVATGLAWADRTFVFEEGLNGWEGFEDTSIFSERLDNAGGGFDGLFAGTTNQFDDRRALLKVDLSAIPPQSVVTSVSLQLTVRASGGNFGDFDLSLYPLTKDWGEGNAVSSAEGGFGAPAAEGDATWDQNFHQQSDWDNLGGDFTMTASATAAAGREGDVASWSSASMAADVQGWLDNSATNFGWILISEIEGEGQRVKRFQSSEADADRPRLVITIESGFPEDIDFNGVANAVDVQLTINEALGMSIAPLTADTNDDELTNAVDVQRVINAALAR